jgi:hypothetical protein
VFRQPPQIVQDERKPGFEGLHRSLKQSRWGRLDPALIDALEQEVSANLIGPGQLLVVRQIFGVVLVDRQAVPRRNCARNGCFARNQARDRPRGRDSIRVH